MYFLIERRYTLIDIQALSLNTVLFSLYFFAHSLLAHFLFVPYGFLCFCTRKCESWPRSFSFLHVINSFFSRRKRVSLFTRLICFSNFFKGVLLFSKMPFLCLNVKIRNLGSYNHEDLTLPFM